MHPTPRFDVNVFDGLRCELFGMFRFAGYIVYCFSKCIQVQGHHFEKPIAVRKVGQDLSRRFILEEVILGEFTYKFQLAVSDPCHEAPGRQWFLDINWI